MVCKVKLRLRCKSWLDYKPPPAPGQVPTVTVAPIRTQLQGKFPPPIPNCSRQLGPPFPGLSPVRATLRRLRPKHLSLRQGPKTKKNGRFRRGVKPPIIQLACRFCLPWRQDVVPDPSGTCSLFQRTQILPTFSSWLFCASLFVWLFSSFSS